MKHVIDGASLVDTYRTLDRELDFEQKTAFMIAMRAHRAGGLTKDAVYLRGLIRLMRYLAKGGELDTLYVGKINVNHVPLVKELTWRKVLVPPPLRPLYLDRDGAMSRLNVLRDGASLLDLVEDGRKK